MSGSAKGAGVVTFASDSTLNGYVISDQPQDIISFSGSWSLIGTKISGTISTEEAEYTFSGTAVAGKSISVKAINSDNTRDKPSFSGKPSASQVNFGGAYFGRIKPKGAAFNGSLDLSVTEERNRYTASCSFSVGGIDYSYEGEAVVDSTGAFRAVLSGDGPDGSAITVLFGKIAKGKLTFSWKSYDSDGTSSGTGLLNKY